MSGSLADKTALVTGGSRGIGRAVALALAGEGAEVIVAARGLEGAQTVAEEITGAGGRARAVSMDISDDSSVTETVAALLEDYARIPLLVNNAGVTRDNLLMRMKKEDWQVVIETNLTGLYRTCRALVPSMIRGRYGRIVNVGSVVGHFGNPGQSNYAAAKAGLEGFTRSLAREVASRNITVNAVAPGFIDTDMTRDLPEKAREQLIGQIPLERLGTSADVAGVVKFLVGDKSSYITGATLHVNGGMYT
jgi:3-oxoacyl-[acyl-carrier protein] reductase